MYLQGSRIRTIPRLKETSMAIFFLPARYGIKDPTTP
jgi:hypothetical protein